ncbi:hypothetical protein [Geomicrobium sediminis]|uniref:Uncharacterized protein n=1 Tax=Geomicrobium sediminis TaxID=1347788 RepID=A0ABS2P7R3_9BACL|nr:hypothetical protein [Geomicrobium sediminis]MBM7631090.1 hypothetical protein [Geomicrobium sediminis]
MATETEKLKLYRANPEANPDEVFDFDRLLNENWEKLDEEAQTVGEFMDSKGEPGGLAELDENGKVKGVEIPELPEMTIENIEGLRDALNRKALIDHSHNPSQVGLGNVINEKQATKIEFDDHTNDNTVHITQHEREKWDSKETPSGAQQKANNAETKANEYTDKHAESFIAHDEISNRKRLNKDDSGIFTTIEWRREDGTLAKRSVLSGGESPDYTQRTVTYFALDGSSTEHTVVYDQQYDEDGDWIEEVPR